MDKGRPHDPCRPNAGMIHNKPNSPTECGYLALSVCTKCGWFNPELDPSPQEAYQAKVLQVVITGEYSEFHRWCYTYGVPPTSKYVRYVAPGTTSVQVAFQGVRNVLVRYYGTYNTRPDLEEIHNILRSIDARVVGSA